jgi:hypothetical protein
VEVLHKNSSGAGGQRHQQNDVTDPPPRPHRSPSGGWVAQQTRNFLMDLGDRATQVFDRDRGSKFTSVFGAVFANEGIRILRTPVHAF